MMKSLSIPFLVSILVAVTTLFSGVKGGPVDLGAADSYAILAGTAVSSTGTVGTVVNGNIGIFPQTGMTGFPPGVINGQADVANTASGEAQGALTTAYNFVAAQPINATLSDQDLGGMTLLPGVYKFAVAASLNGVLTLDANGSANAVWMFQIGTALNIAHDSKINFKDSIGNADYVYWQVGSSATLAAGVPMIGNILAYTAITAGDGASVLGRCLARNAAVNLDKNNITVPPKVTASNPTVAPTVQPTASPSVVASAGPTVANQPTITPSSSPTVTPTATPSTAAPTVNPSADPSANPSAVPSSKPTTLAPSTVPSALPSTVTPTVNPTISPSANPSAVPSNKPTTHIPSATPTAVPSTVVPTVNPTVDPSVNPSAVPSNKPTTLVPSTNPTAAPSTVAPTVNPTVGPAANPTAAPSNQPSVTPSATPTATPSAVPTATPSVETSAGPTFANQPTVPPSVAATGALSTAPTVHPTSAPSVLPSATPSAKPTAAPSVVPTVAPSMEASVGPTFVDQPTAPPSVTVTAAPSNAPTAHPSAVPSAAPSVKPSVRPTFTATSRPTFGELPIDLGLAEPYAILAGATVTSTGVVGTIVTGNIGVFPGSAVTGFPPGILNGAIDAANGAAEGAKGDLTTAYNAVAARQFNMTLSHQDLGGMTLFPGVYKFQGAATMNGMLTLDARGDAAAVWMFQMGSSFTIATGSSVLFKDSIGNPDLVYWQVGSSVTIGAESAMVGNILALASITLNTGVTVKGRCLARNAAVTLNKNVITKPAVVAFTATQTVSGISLEQFNANATTNTAIMKESVAKTMPGVSPTNVKNFEVTAGPTSAALFLRGANGRALASDSIVLKYDVVVSSAKTSEQLQNELKTAVNDGRFNNYMQTAAAEKGATNLQGASSNSVETETITPATPDVSSSDKASALSTGAIVGIVIGAVLGAVIIIAFIVYFCRGSAKTPSSTVVPV